MLFCNIDLLDERFETKRNQYVGVKDGRIAYIGASAPEEDFGERAMTAATACSCPPSTTLSLIHI